MRKHQSEKYSSISRCALSNKALTAGVSLMLACLPNTDTLAVESFCSSNSVASIQQTNFNVVGTVLDSDGQPLPGVTVVVKGGSSGSITDTDGRYIIDVPSESQVLEFSCYGYQTMSIVVGNQRIVNVIMKDEVLKMNEVVVAALGIKKMEKSLTYVSQAIDGEELVKSKDMNLMKSLAGKVAGMRIIQSASGMGGSVKVQIRGARSATGINQPLYVIDGIPINSVSREVTSTTLGGMHDAANRDGGDGISNLNPDDIESINVLKGPASAALYGSSAANGVVVITTKGGKVGRPKVNFSTTTTWDKPVYGIPEFQNSYGGSSSSWGNPISGSENYTDKFFKTGLTTINSVALSTGSEDIQTYFSYANAYGKGIMDHVNLNKHNLNLRETAYFFDSKLRIDAHVNLIHQHVKNRPTPGGFYMNPLLGLYKFPRGGVEGGESFDYYRENYQVIDPNRNMYTQNWYVTPNSFEQNPFWLMNRVSNDEKRFRTLAFLNLSYQFNDYLYVQARGHADFISDIYEAKMYAGTDPALVGKNGRFMSDEANLLTTYGDAILAYDQNFLNFSIHTSLGASIRDVTGKSLGFDSTTHLYHPNIFTVGNINQGSSSPYLNKYHTQEQSVFFAGQLGFKDLLYLDITARNDWTSTLAYTKYRKKGIFYPSVGMAWIMSEVINFPDWVNTAKVHAAWSKVGNDIPAYLSAPLNTCGNSGVIDFNTTAPFTDLKPEMTTSVEVGTQWRLFNNHIDLDVTYYNTRTRNQLFTLPAPAGSKYTWYYVNAGNIKNEGVGVILTANPFTSQNFSWKSSVNYAINKNTVVKLVDGMNHFNLSPLTTSNSYTMRLEEGGSYGDIYGRKFLRDQEGYLLRDQLGMPMPDKSDLKKIGNCNPDFLLSWQNTFRYKDFSLGFLIDGSFGGDVVSLTQAELDKYGVSKVTGDARNNGGVLFGGAKIPDTELFYNTVGGRDGITEYYVYDATNIRLRELVISYSLPSKWLARQSVLKGLDISLIGRNLFFFVNNAPYDPDATLSVGNNLQGVDVFGMPTTRSLGFNLRLKF